MPNPDFIVDELTAVHPDGTRSIVVVRIGKPFQEVKGGPHTCLVQRPFSEKRIAIHGEGPMQALHLGLMMLRIHLELEEKERGIRFVFPDTDDNHDWRRFWYGDGEPA